MQPWRAYECKAGAGKGLGGFVQRVMLFKVVYKQFVHITGGFHFFLWPEVIKYVGGMVKGFLYFRVTAFVFGGYIGHTAGYFYKLVAPVVGLSHNALVGFGDMMLNPDVAFQPKPAPYLGA